MTVEERAGPMFHPPIQINADENLNDADGRSPDAAGAPSLDL